jgi:hypothetical protein
MEKLKQPKIGLIPIRLHIYMPSSTLKLSLGHIKKQLNCLETAKKDWLIIPYEVGFFDFKLPLAKKQKNSRKFKKKLLPTKIRVY